MLSGEGIQRRKKVKNNNIGLISKSNFARAAHFFVHFPVVLPTKKNVSFVFYLSF